MAHAGTLHLYTPKLTAFEHSPTPASSSPPSNIILFIGGLGDGPLTVRYPTAIAKALPAEWRIAEVLLSSSYQGWGTGSLQRDAEQINACVEYFKRRAGGDQDGKVVLMGHSTGCQDVMEYLVGAGCSSRSRVDGAVLQGGLSDREAWADMAASDEELKCSLESTIELAKSIIERGKGEDILPKEGNKVIEMFEAPCSAYRAYSLLAPGGNDDYFSTDLANEVFERTFGRVPEETKMMFLWGSADAYIPGHVDKEETLRKWAGVVKRGGARVDEENGGVVVEGTHSMNDDKEETVGDLVGRVVRFVGGL